MPVHLPRSEQIVPRRYRRLHSPSFATALRQRKPGSARPNGFAPADRAKLVVEQSDQNVTEIEGKSFDVIPRIMSQRNGKQA
jgi:hypothetical protein